MNKGNPDEYKNLKLKVFGLPEGTDIREKFSKIIDEQLPTFMDYNDSDVDRVIRYIVFLYDKNSPMQVRFPDIKVRRDQCAMLAGFNGTLESFDDLHTLERGKFQPVLGHNPPEEEGGEEEPILGGWVFPLAAMVAQYCISQRHHKWTIIMTHESLFAEYTQEILLPITTFKDQKQKLDATMVKSKLRVELEIIEAKLDGLYTEVFGASRAVEVARTKATTPERRNRAKRNV